MSTDTPGFAFRAEVLNGAGEIAALLGGDNWQGASLTVAPGAGAYEVLVSAAGREMQGTVVVSLGDVANVAEPRATEEAPQPEATE